MAAGGAGVGPPSAIVVVVGATEPLPLPLPLPLPVPLQLPLPAAVGFGTESEFRFITPEGETDSEEGRRSGGGPEFPSDDLGVDGLPLFVAINDPRLEFRLFKDVRRSNFGGPPPPLPAPAGEPVASPAPAFRLGEVEPRRIGLIEPRREGVIGPALSPPSPLPLPLRFGLPEVVVVVSVPSFAALAFSIAARAADVSNRGFVFRFAASFALKSCSVCRFCLTNFLRCSISVR